MPRIHLTSRRALGFAAAVWAPGVLLAGAIPTAWAQAPAPSVLSQDEAVTVALRQNPTLEGARRERNAGIIQSDRQRPAFRPEVTASASQIVRGPRVELPGTNDVVLPNSISRLEIEVRQPLYQFGAGSAPRERANALAAAARSSYRRAELDVIRDVREAFLAVERTAALARVAARGAELARANTELTRALKEGGLQADVDVLEAERAEAEAQSRLLQAENGGALARANLNRLLGRPVDTPFQPGEPVPSPPPPASLAELTAVAAERRPEIQLLRHNIEAATAGIRLAKASRLPRVSLEAGYALQTETALLPRNGVYGGLTITAPIFDGAVQRFTVREAEERLKQLRSTLQAAEQGIALELERERLAMQEATARLGVAERAIAAAEKVHEITRLKLERGMATQIEVLNARLALERALASRAEAEADLRLARARLDRALGEGPTLEQAPAVPGSDAAAEQTGGAGSAGGRSRRERSKKTDG